MQNMVVLFKNLVVFYTFKMYLFLTYS